MGLAAFFTLCNIVQIFEENSLYKTLPIVGPVNLEATESYYRSTIIVLLTFNFNQSQC